MDCLEATSCLMMPSSCTNTCFSIDAPGPGIAGTLLGLGFTVSDPDVPGSVTLPDNRITAHGVRGNQMLTDPLTLVDGSISWTMTKDHFDAKFDVTFMNAAGDSISVINGTYHLVGGTQSQCSAVMSRVGGRWR